MHQRVICTLALGSLGLLSARLNAGSGLILNEYNAVSDTQFLATDITKPYKGYDYGSIAAATAGAGAGNTGRILGNGGNWAEFVVTQDHLDLRGWSLNWSNADPDQGTITFNQTAYWSNMRAGTIITIIEDGLQTPTFSDGTQGPIMNLNTDTSFSPQHNDWSINFDVDDATYLTQAGFKVDNDNWQMTIKNAAGQVMEGPIGESSPGWGGGGISSQESGALVTDPNANVTNGNYSDQDYTTFGQPNKYSANSKTQDLSPLETWWTNRLAGDANCDGKVDIADLGILASHWQTNGNDWFAADFNNDGVVDISDLGILASNWQAGQSFSAALSEFAPNVPEPTSICVMSALSAAVLRRRRTV